MSSRSVPEAGAYDLAGYTKRDLFRSLGMRGKTLKDNIWDQIQIPQKAIWSPEILDSLSMDHLRILAGPDSAAKNRIVDQLTYEARSQQSTEELVKAGDKWAEDILEVGETTGGRVPDEADIAYGREVDRQEEIRYRELEREQASGVDIGSPPDDQPLDHKLYQPRQVLYLQ